MSLSSATPIPASLDSVIVAPMPLPPSAGSGSVGERDSVATASATASVASPSSTGGTFNAAGTLQSPPEPPLIVAPQGSTAEFVAGVAAPASAAPRPALISTSEAALSSSAAAGACDDARSGGSSSPPASPLPPPAVAAGDYFAQPSQARLPQLRALGQVIRALELATMDAKNAADPKRNGGAFLAALASAERELLDHGDVALPETSFPIGLQLLPDMMRRYRAPWALAMIAADSLTLGCAGRCLGFRAIRENNLVIVREREGYDTFRPILDPRPSTQIEYEGIRYTAVRASTRLLLIWFILLLINIGGWIISLINISVGPATNPLQPILAFVWQGVGIMVTALADGTPPLLPLALWAALGTIICAVAFMLAVMGKASGASHISLAAGSISSVAPLILAPRAPLAMVSYNWSPPFADMARSLASCVPGMWLDIQMLASGSDPKIVTQNVSRWSLALVVLLSPDYLRSPACCLELVTGLLYRRKYQNTLLYYDAGAVRRLLDGKRDENDAPLYSAAQRAAIEARFADVLAALEAISPILRSAPALVSRLDGEVFSAATTEALAHSIKWFQRVSTPALAVRRSVRLPAPQILADQSVISCCCSRLCAPRGAICAGSAFISADGVERGRRPGISLEQALLALAAAFFIVMTAIAAASTGPLVPPLFTIALVIIVGIMDGIFITSALPLSLDFDFRRTHSELLLPLNVAAFLSATKSTFAPLTRRDKAFVRAASLSVAAAAAGGGGNGDGGSGSGSGSGGAPALERALASAPASSEQRALNASHFDVRIIKSTRFASGGREPDCPDLDARLENVAAFLNGMGLTTTIHAVSEAALAAEADPLQLSASEHVLDRSESNKLAIFVLCTPAAITRYLERWSRIFPSACSVLVADKAAIMAEEAARGLFSKAILILLGKNGGVSDDSAYRNEGLATAILDALGAKVGPALLAAVGGHEAEASGAGSASHGALAPRSP